MRDAVAAAMSDAGYGEREEAIAGVLVQIAPHHTDSQRAKIIVELHAEMRQLPEKRERQVELARSFKQSTVSLDEAVRILFDNALPIVPLNREPAIIKDYENLRRAWRSEYLVKGPREHVESVIRMNLSREANCAGFQFFSVDLSVEEVGREGEAWAGQVNVFRNGSVAPIRVWRSELEDTFFACGNAAFRE